VAREQLANLVDVEAAPVERPVPVGGTIRGSLDPDLIRQEVRRHADEIRACYEAQLTTTPGVAGKVMMKWGIDGAGVVRQATVAESGFAHAPVLDACLIATVRSMRFPAPTGGGIVIVNYPFVFKQS
ncbi:MAG TPA: AgmX/PglI C-terminal domain-containing protein, partial [Myxococcota bacterium]